MNKPPKNRNYKLTSIRDGRRVVISLKLTSTKYGVKVIKSSIKNIGWEVV